MQLTQGNLTLSVESLAKTVWRGNKPGNGLKWSESRGAWGHGRALDRFTFWPKMGRFG